MNHTSVAVGIDSTERGSGPIEGELDRSFGLLDQLRLEIGNLADHLRIALNPSEFAEVRAVASSPAPSVSPLLSRLQDLNTKAGTLVEAVQSVNSRIEL